MFVKRETVKSVEVREHDCCQSEISALTTNLVSLLIINVCKVSHVLLGSLTNA